MFLTIFVCSLILVVSETSSYNIVVINNTSPKIDFSTNQEEYLMIYETLPIVVNATTVGEVSTDIFGLRNNPINYEGNYFVQEGNESLEMDSASGAIFYADYSKLWNVSYSPDLLTLPECETTANQILSSKREIFYNYIFKGFGSTNLTATNTETSETIDKLLNIHVYYEFELAGIPIRGPGGTSSITLGNEGEVVGLSWLYRDVEPAYQSEQIPIATILEKYRIEDYIDLKHELVYFAEARGIEQNYLCPVYELEITKLLGGEEITYYVHTPATAFQPNCEIIEPTSEETFAYNDTVTFDCQVVGGTAPYTYNWESDINGFLSSAKTFTNKELKVEFKNESLINHIITLTVTDDNGLTCEDSIEVVIQSHTYIFGSEFIVIFLTSLIGLSFYMMQKKSKKRRLLSLGLISCCLFMLPMSQIMFARGDIEHSQRYPTVNDTGDDDIREIGCEYVKYSGDDYLPNSDDRAYDLYNYIDIAAGWSKKFIWGGNNAWEQDFKFAAAAGGGTDYNWIDAVDLAYYTGHGNPSGITFTSSHDNTWLDHTEASWGDQDLEWIVLDSCSVLRKETDDGETVFDRWGPALDGVHLILGFHTGATDKESRGKKFGFNLQEWDFTLIKFNAMRVKDAWFKACKDTESSSKWCAVLYATQSNDPWNPQLNDPIHDYIWGQGYVSSDPTSPKWWVWLASSC